MDFSKFDKMVDIEGLKKDIADVEANGGGGDFKDVPHGSYEVAIDKRAHRDQEDRQADGVVLDEDRE